MLIALGVLFEISCFLIDGICSGINIGDRSCRKVMRERMVENEIFTVEMKKAEKWSEV